MPIVGFNIKAVTVVLFIKPEVSAEIIITKKRITFGGCFFKFTSLAIKVSITPVFLSAPTIINMAARMIMKSLEKPSKASFGVMILKSDRQMRINMVTTSTVNTSIAKSIIANSNNPKTMAMFMYFYKVQIVNLSNYKPQFIKIIFGETK